VATEAALFQRQERDLAQTRPIQGQLAMRSHWQAPRAEPRHSSRPSRQARGAGSRLVRRLDTGQLCPRCGALLGSRQRTCVSCGLRLPRREGRGSGGNASGVPLPAPLRASGGPQQAVCSPLPEPQASSPRALCAAAQLASLQAGNAPGDPETSLLLGVGELGRMLRVRPTQVRRESRRPGEGRGFWPRASCSPGREAWS
jgi:hypothetical protein